MDGSLGAQIQELLSQKKGDLRAKAKTRAEDDFEKILANIISKSQCDAVDENILEVRCYTGTLGSNKVWREEYEKRLRALFRDRGILCVKVFSVETTRHGGVGVHLKSGTGDK